MAVNIETGESFYVEDVSVWDPVGKIQKSISKAKLLAITKCDKELNQKSLKRKHHDNYHALGSQKVKNSKIQKLIDTARYHCHSAQKFALAISKVVWTNLF